MKIRSNLIKLAQHVCDTTAKTRLKYISSLLTLILLPSLSSADTKVIGYIAAFNNMTATIDSVDLSRLTHINVSFANPDINGVIIDKDVMTCMSGIEGSNVNAARFATLSIKPTKRA